MEELEKTHYNKAYINDNFEYTHLHDPRTWKPLNQKRRWDFFIKPVYATKDDYQSETPFKR